MFSTGIGDKFKDRRIDKILIKRGIRNAIIFYSPITVWVVFSVAIFVIFAASFPILSYKIIIKYTPYPIGYVVVGYLVAAYLNNSIAIKDSCILIVNPNPPFRRVVEFKKAQVRCITISSRVSSYWLSPFLITNLNFLEIQTEKQTHKYYCAGLDLDSYDENWTKETLDDLYAELKKEGYNVELKIMER